LLNGIAGKPLSPLLFVLAAYLLQSIINRAWNSGILRHPISNGFEEQFPIMQYADDTLLILPADAMQLLTLKGLLKSFLDSTRLHVNFQKSYMFPINVSAERINHLA
jgi:hypothetical protein